MKKSHFILIIPLALLLVLGFSSCKEDDPDIQEPAGKIVFNFLHHWDGAPVLLDTAMYINAAGNRQMISEIQYFVSDVTLHRTDGGTVKLVKENDIYYVDSDMPGTQQWKVFDPVPVGSYTGVSFTFGINEQKNQSFMFVNPPEVNMVWPEFLGGGYHYLKLNGKFWDDPYGYLRGFEYHLGIGQIYPPNSHNYDSIIEFVHNHFDVILANSAFEIQEGQTITMDIIMNIEEWFRNPHTWDHFYWGTYTMESQDALQTIKENGHNVFTTGTIR